jgi:hypothetical protein
VGSNLYLIVGCQDSRTVGSIGEFLIKKSRSGSLVVAGNGHIPMEEF